MTGSLGPGGMRCREHADGSQEAFDMGWPAWEQIASKVKGK